MERKGTHRFEEDLEDATGLFVDETRDTFDTATTSETADSGLRDTCLSSSETKSDMKVKRTYPGCCHEGSCDDA